MSWFLLALLGQCIFGTSALLDKLLLKKSYPNPVGYAFWVGILGLTVFLFAPFYFEPVSYETVLWALFAGGIFMAGMFFYFLALYQGESTGSVVSISAFSPIATLAFSFLLLGQGIVGYELFSFVFLVLGGFLLAGIERKELRLRSFFWVLLAAGLLGLSNVLAKIVFSETNFMTGFAWMKAGGAVFALLLLAYPSWRQAILHPAGKDEFRNRSAYVLNRAYAGIGSLVVFYALSIGSAPLVDAMQSVRFLVLFIGGWLLFRERIQYKKLAAEFAAFTLVSLGVIFLGAGDYFRATAPSPARPIAWGVTFSQKFADSFGIPWQETYEAILGDLGVRYIRLVAYWDVLEPQNGTFAFDSLDYQVSLAERYGVSVIMAVGQKVPRWPECHYPSWAADLPEGERRKELEELLQATVERYKNSPSIRYWQVENEPFLPFGECPKFDKAFYEKEILLVKNIDPLHPVLATDSGELGRWYPAAKRGDVFGTTMYRRVHNDIIGYFDYHLPPEFFRAKELVVKTLLGDFEKRFLVIELAAEPWLKRQPYETTPEEQFKVFDYDFFLDTMEYARKTGFDEYYFWGAEWWYWLKERHGDARFWNAARERISGRQ